MMNDRYKVTITVTRLSFEVDNPQEREDYVEEVVVIDEDLSLALSLASAAVENLKDA
jgi:hypothetical protein